MALAEETNGGEGQPKVMFLARNDAVYTHTHKGGSVPQTTRATPLTFGWLQLFYASPDEPDFTLKK